MEKRTKDNPWKLKTPPQTSDYEMYVDTKGWEGDHRLHGRNHVLHYDYRCLADLHAMLKKHGDWMELGSKDEKQETVEGTVEHWARSPKNPSAAGMDSRKASKGALPCTFHH
jgi:hypothetical protein